MVKHTLNILQCEQHKILKYVWPFFHIVKESVKTATSSGIFTKWKSGQLQ